MFGSTECVCVACAMAAVANVANKIVQVKVDMNIYMEMVLNFG